MSRYDTPATHCTEGVLVASSLGNIYCTFHGDEDVPSWDEITANVTEGYTVEIHPANRVLYVVEA